MCAWGLGQRASARDGSGHLVDVVVASQVAEFPNFESEEKLKKVLRKTGVLNDNPLVCLERSHAAVYEMVLQCQQWYCKKNGRPFSWCVALSRGVVCVWGAAR